MELAIYHYGEERWNPITDLTIQCSYDAFLKTWIDTSERILLDYGIVGYREMWVEYEFPLSTFLKLKYYLEHHSKFPISNKMINEITIKKRTIDMELDYIKKT